MQEIAPEKTGTPMGKWIGALMIMQLCTAGTQAQQGLRGCTDPAALNFDTSARVNDGTCKYAVERKDPRSFFQMPEGLQEQSGMVWWHGRLWIHNDGGAPPVIMALDSTGTTVLSSVTLRGATNIDWEDMAQDDQYFYIADAGNNAHGARNNLCVYRVSKQHLLALDSNLSVQAERIDFQFEDQAQPPVAVAPNTTNFDTEAIICRDGHIFLFTKQWTGRQTALYKFPAVPGKQIAKRMGTMDAGGLITGAAISPDGKTVVLTGYSPLLSRFVWLLYGFNGDAFFEGHRRVIRLTGPGQTESACFLDNDRLLLGSEQFRMLPERMEILWLGDLLAPYRRRLEALVR
jgi:hypothetical protein